MFSIPVWAIVLICLSPFLITFTISLTIGLVNHHRKMKKEKEEDDHHRLS